MISILTGLITLTIINDETLNTELQTILEEGQVENKAVPSIEDALSLINESNERIAAILIEIPEDNLEFERSLRCLKKNKQTKYLPIIGLIAPKTSKDQISRQLYFHLLRTPLRPYSVIHTIESAHSNFKHYQDLLHQVKSRTSAIGLITAGNFRLQTLQEAEALTTMLSLACPDPSILALGLSELLVNAIEHGNLGITYDEKSTLLENGEWENEVERRLSSSKNKDKYVEVDFHREQDKIVFSIRDRGKGFNWQKYITADPQNLTEKHGRGIAIAIAMGFYEIKYNEKGNKVTASVHL